MDVYNKDFLNRRILKTDHHGLVAGTCKLLKIKEFIDLRLPKTSNNYKLSHGDIFVCMIVNALGFTSQPVYLYPEFFQGVDTKILFGEDFDPKYLNDDAVERTLDAIFDYGVSKLYLELGQEVLPQITKSSCLYHLDSTSFHVHGEKYDNFRRISVVQGKSEQESVKITHGYSRDGHPELAQVMLQMIVDNVAGIPLMMKPQDGNTNDNQGFKNSFNIAKSLIKSMKQSNQNAYLVADAALYTEENLQELNQSDNKLLFISRAPSKIKAVSDMIKRAKNDGFEHIKDQYSGVIYDFEYAGVKQKILVVKSTEANKRVIKSIDSKSQKELEKITKNLTKLSKQEFNCEPDAIKAYEKIIKSLHFTKAIKEPKIKTIAIYKAGRKSATSEPIGFKYHIHGEVVINEEAIIEAKEEDSCFVIATNDYQRNWTMVELLDSYKSQQRVERGFRFLKDPQFFADSIFLKTPRRIESLLMIMVSTLLIHSATEYILRDNLKRKNKTVRNQVNKQVQNPTMRWVYSLFNMVSIGRMFIDGVPIPSTLTPDQYQVIEALSGPWEEIYKPFIP